MYEGDLEHFVSAQSEGIGVRVIVNGAWGFAATSDLTPKGAATAARQASAIAKANAKSQTRPVQLAPTTGVGVVE